jgi:hypothetical protein
MQKFILLLAICISSFAIAQTPKPTVAPITKTVIGYFNYDSLLVLLPGYKEKADSANAVNELGLMNAE